jgi:2-oxoglutarate ferredoxin oxidoreductase subunit gamma
MQLTEIRIAGFGGQGVILSAIVIGKAASIVEGHHATMTQNFGPEARGGACSAQLIVSDRPVLYPYLTNTDIMVLMSQEAYTRFSPELRRGGLMLIEQDLVRVSSIPVGTRIFGIPATRIAEELGKRMVLNIVMTGFFGAISGLLQRDSLRQAIETSVPSAFREINLKAYDRGFDYGLEHLKNGALTPSELEAELVRE